MPLPVGYLHQKKDLGNGTIGSVQHYEVETMTAGADINFGVGVTVQNDQVITANQAPIVGIAIKRDYVLGDDYTSIKNDHWVKGEKIGVLWQGAVAVPITADVNRLDPATVNADGTFKPAESGDKVVGRFITAGDKDRTAIVHVNLTDMGTENAGTTPSSPAPSSGSDSGSGSPAPSTGH